MQGIPQRVVYFPLVHGTVWHGGGEDPKEGVDLVLMLEAAVCVLCS